MIDSDVLQEHRTLLFTLYFLIYYPSWLSREPCGVGVQGHMFCSLVEPAWRASCEEVSAAWQSGTHLSLLALDKTGRTGAMSFHRETASLPGSVAGMETLSSVGSLSWWEGEQPQLLSFLTFTSDCQRNFCGVKEFMFVLYLKSNQTLSECLYFCVCALPKNSRIAVLVSSSFKCVRPTLSNRNIIRATNVSHVCHLKFSGEFPGGTLCFHCRGHGFNPWSGN